MPATDGCSKLATSYMEAAFAGRPASTFIAISMLGAGSAVDAISVVGSLIIGRKLSVLRATIAIPVALPVLKMLSDSFFSRRGRLALATKKVLVWIYFAEEPSHHKSLRRRSRLTFAVTG